jgi:hypothetical protein
LLGDTPIDYRTKGFVARIPLIEAVRAHELLEHGGYAGKVVLVAD